MGDKSLVMHHHVFLPGLGDADVYHSLVTLCRALAQFLLSLPKIPPSFHINQDKEADILKFVVMSVEAVSWHLVHEQVPLSVDLQAVLDCCCLTLQQPTLWTLLASAEYMTHACSLISCTRFIIEAGKAMPCIILALCILHTLIALHYLLLFTQLLS
ncbi:hypothetical protein GDO81_027006 [Engystomops pustulosus]|uniref:Uncharacterized protein n=1 Tax=Engystomops pustulosus TaxID=76066 RepID=A0AAV6YLK4_ENGPU|nr:hypothetical protein GDO81_027006 [Engystomops pustulosus]